MSPPGGVELWVDGWDTPVSVTFFPRRIGGKGVLSRPNFSGGGASSYIYIWRI